MSLYSDDNDTRDFVTTVKQFSPRLVVIDTLAMAMSGGDENRTQDIAIVLKNMKKIQQELGCHVMVLHHPGKDDSRGVRGSSALHAASDNVLELKKTKDVVCVRAENEVKRGLAAAIVFHDLNLAAHFSDKILLLSRGNVLDFGPPKEILTPSRSIVNK